ncbi:helix-turn-helix transcriptional regulator [Bifidobacterium margollesii]|uniref:Helix-turn-helix transcriptional regulator n=1 Tax=Bifidobacterium margollesii TaxID=2020964 RepID=A0A2N5JAZ0_9BIFI|nr:LuxR C-terminal-related transcriptional regulator [Bifidobacterium margollesii]PLS31374.1 helix-turn-helix transcriptional regulator [Bifidobacterium margollesii]
MTLPVNGSGPAGTRSSGISANALAERLVEAAAYLHHQEDARDIARYMTQFAHQVIPIADGISVNVRVSSLNAFATLGVFGYPHFSDTMLVPENTDQMMTSGREIWAKTAEESESVVRDAQCLGENRYVAVSSMGIRHQSLMIMPIMVDDRFLGTMLISSWTRQNAFRADDRARLRMLAQITALALDDARCATIYRSDGQSIRVPIHDTAAYRRSAAGLQAGGRTSGQDGHTDGWSETQTESQSADSRTDVGSAITASATDVGIGPIPEFTDRELSVLKLIGAGLTSREIADQLFISVNTVRTHRTNLLGKLNVHSSPAAVAKARELGLLH